MHDRSQSAASPALTADERPRRLLAQAIRKQTSDLSLLTFPAKRGAL